LLSKSGQPRPYSGHGPQILALALDGQAPRRRVDPDRRQGSARPRGRLGERDARLPCGTGLAVVDARAEPMRLLASVTLKLGPKLAPYECLGRIADAVEALARAHAVTHAAIEETIYVQNFRTAQAMGASRGAALGVLARLGVKVGEYAPTRIKLAVAGHGSAKKEQVGRMVRSVLGLPAELALDESDAAAAALCHAFTARG
jgi:crossover junction endodeoxyribonuclease RuvC